MRTVLLVIFYLVLASGVSVAQSDQNPETNTQPADTSLGDQILDNVQENIKLSGEIGAFGELYSVSGRESRRPGSSGRIFFRPSMSIYDRITLSLDLFVSSEGSAARQDINTVGFSPEWSWGKLYYGDFNMEVSKFTMADVKVNGYGIDLFPGIFKMMAFSGTSQKALALESSTSMFQRTIYGGKIGLGELDGSHFHINFVRSYDDKKSLARSIFLQVDTVMTGQGPRIDSSFTGVKPQENLILGTNWGLNMFDDAFKIKTEGAVSLFTGDTYADGINNKDVPEALSKYFSPNITTSGDAAVATEMSVTTKVLSLKGGYTLVGPGYTSHGLGSLINDRQIITGGVGLNLFSGGLSVQTNFQQHTDNTADQKKFTSERNTLGVVVAMRPWKSFMVTVMSNTNTMGNSATNDTLKIDNENSTLGVNTSYNFSAFELQHVLTVSYIGVNNVSKSKLRGDNEIVSTNFNAGLSTVFSKTISATLGGAMSEVDLGPIGTNSTSTFNGKVNHKAFDGKLTNSLTISAVSSDVHATNVLGFQSSYQLFQQSAVALLFRGTFFKGKGNNKQKFNEFMTTLNWTYRI
ncbi:MAG: hypothetical protein IT279_04785 [Ignavibacteriaceae bacterium]|nr:hypothetical protein [Ignavibacteriaceae bacterium]